MIFGNKKYIRDFPFIRQTGMMQCGPACMAMIFKYYGYYNIAPLLTKMTEVSTAGVNLYSMIEVAEQFGFQADAYEMEFENFSEIKMPCIAHYGGIHFIVVYRVTEEYVWVADPAYGKDKIRKEEFLKKWNGVAMSLEPTAQLFRNKDLEESVQAFREEHKSLFSRFYAPVLASLRPVIFQVLLATALLQALGLAIPFFTQTIVDSVLVNQNRKMLMVILMGMFAVFATQTILLYVRNILLVDARVRFELDFFSRFFKHFIGLSQKYYDNNKREDFMARFQENLTIRQLVNPGLLECVVDLLFVLLYLPVLLLYNIKLGLAACGFVALFAFVTIYYAPRIRALVYKVFYRNLETLGDFLDTLLGMQSVKLLGIENFKFWQWKNKYKRTLNVVMEAEQKSAMLHSVQRSIYYVSQVGIFWLGAFMAFQNEISIGQYIAITAIFLLILNSLNNLSLVWYNIAEVLVSLDRLDDVLLQKEENRSVLDLANDFSTFPVEVQGVNFKYNQSQDGYVLRKLDLTIKPGEHIGIVGRNGSGKSTLVKILLNLYPEYEGSIRFGKTDMQRINPAALRKKVFLYPQDVYVFNGTIKENIMLANLDADIEDVIRAAKLADLHDFVTKQYLGYNYKIGDLGANLSGGQKLKLGFARLFLSDPDLIILDEASSMLDVESEQKIMNNIKSHFKDKSIISIAHRMQTLRNADRIWVIDEGQIVQEGSHETLMQVQDGLYYGFMKTYIAY